MALARDWEGRSGNWKALGDIGGGSKGGRGRWGLRAVGDIEGLLGVGVGDVGAGWQ